MRFTRSFANFILFARVKKIRKLIKIWPKISPNFQVQLLLQRGVKLHRKKALTNTVNYRHQAFWLEPQCHDRRRTGRTAERTLRTTCICPVLPACMTSRCPQQRALRSRDRERRRRLATAGTWRRSPGNSWWDFVWQKILWKFRQKFPEIFNRLLNISLHKFWLDSNHA